MLAFLSMLNIQFKKLAVLAAVLFVQPMVSPGSFAFARRKSPPRAFSFFAEGGKASQEECDGERKVPRKMKRLKDFAKTGSYIGSEAQTFEIKSKDDKEMFKHFFNSKSACNAVLAKTPSYAKKDLKDVKQELPPDEAAETDDDDKSDSQDDGQQEEGPAAAPVANTTPAPAAIPAAAPAPEASPK